MAKTASKKSRKAKKELYSDSFGTRGVARVRVWEPREGANFMIAPFLNGKYQDAYTLGHRDEDKAAEQACALVNDLKNGKYQKANPDHLTLKVLVDSYLGSESYQDLKPQQQNEKRALLAKIVDYLGPGRLVTSIDDDAVRGLLRARREGTHGFRKAGKQSEYHCFTALRSVILWGLEKKNQGGVRLLRENPIAGMAKRLKITINKTPDAPVIGHDTFTALRRAARKKLPMYIRVFLVVVEGTGRRAGSVRELEWADVSLETGMIRWEPDSDKMDRASYHPMPRHIRHYLRIWKHYCPSDRWVFPAERDATRCVSKSTVNNWTEMLYKAAGLVRPPRTGIHALRRKFASERIGHAMPLLMEAGGWASSAALMRYIKTDPKSVGEVIQRPTRRLSA